MEQKLNTLQKISKKIRSIFKTNVNTQPDIPTGGMELLRRLSGGTYGQTELMSQYSKSLYVFACISKIASKVAAQSLKMYRVKNSKGDIQEIKSHPALDLLYKFNPFQTKTEFLETTMINLKTTGDAFWYKVRNTSGKVAELWNLRPDRMVILSDPQLFVKEYRFSKADGTTATFSPEDIIHFRYPNPLDDLLGLSPLKAAETRVQTEEYATQYQRDFFLNSSRPDAVIKNPKQVLNDEARQEIRENWEKRYQGVGKNSKIAILQGGMEYQVISLTQKEMDYIESMKFTRDDILVAFHMPKPIVAITDDVNLANAETAMQVFLSETIYPELVRLEEKINEELIAPEYGEELYVEFINPTPQDKEFNLKEHTELVAGNIMLINEARELRGLPPIAGGWSFYMPLTNTPMGGLSQTGKAKGIKIGGDKEDDAYIGGKPSKEKKFEFVGKYYLKQKFELKEKIEEKVAEMFDKIQNRKGKKGKKDEENGKKTPIIQDPELKKIYADMVNKKIDLNTNRIKDEISGFAGKQKDRTLSNLDEAIKSIKTTAGFEKKGTKERIKLNAHLLLNLQKENELAVEFISPFLLDLLTQAGIDAINMLAPQEEFNVSKRIQTTLEKRAKFFADSTNNTTLDKLSATLSEGIDAGEGIADLRSRVENVYAEFPTYRSELIARTETTAANAEGTLEGYRQSGVANGKEWITASDGCEICLGLDGEIVALEKNFSDGEPYPPDHPNCRCVLGGAFIE